MLRFVSFRGAITPLRYAVAAPALLLSQHALVFAAYRMADMRLEADRSFWLLPLRRLSEMPGLSAWAAALGFLFSLAIAWAIAILSFRRASWSGYGHIIAGFSIIPAVQIAIIAALAIAPSKQIATEPDPSPSRANTGHILQGVLSGIAIIVVAVLVSAVTFGSYGWGLFVATPFLVGITTAYLANRDVALPAGQTSSLVLAAAALGSVALIMFALEGFVCILLAAPLGAVVAVAGGALGRAAAMIGHRRGKPLLSIALLPAIFALEGAMPPAVAIHTGQSIVIAAPPSAVWHTLTSSDPIGSKPTLIAGAGFAYAIRGRLFGTGVGTERIGEFSTGHARERVTEWMPERRLTFVVLTQPPMMEEMSPYRRVHAPHVSGYFETKETSFQLDPLTGGRTRLTARASHMLRLDPALYWEPMARWAIAQNVDRVLNSIKARAEASN